MVFPWFYFQTHESHILCQVCTPLNTLHLSTFPLNNWPVIPVSTPVDVKPTTAPGDHVVALFLEGDHCSSIGAPCCFVLPSSSIPKPPQHPHAGSVSVVPSRGLPSIPSKSLKWEETEPDTKTLCQNFYPLPPHGLKARGVPQVERLREHLCPHLHGIGTERTTSETRAEKTPSAVCSGLKWPSTVAEFKKKKDSMNGNIMQKIQIL